MGDNRLISKNGRKGIVIEYHQAFEKGFVKHMSRLSSNVPLQSEIWVFQLIYISHTLSSLMFLPSSFQIISGLSTNTQSYCLYTFKNSLINGMRLSLDVCRGWKSFGWTMDYQGMLKMLRILPNVLQN